MADPDPKPRWLLLAAASSEAAAIARAFGCSLGGSPAIERVPRALSPRVDLVQTGVGKVNAALAAFEWGHTGYAAAVNLGICGSLPGSSPPFPDGGCLSPGTIIVASESVYADEGVATPAGFQDLTALGFPPSGCFDKPDLFAGSRVRTDAGLRAALCGELPDAIVAVVATVSTCSGTDALAHAIASRTGAAAEAMEGAAIGHALAFKREGALPFAEVRVVSNNTGDRARQRWDMKAALAGLERVAAAIARLAEGPAGKA